MKLPVYFIFFAVLLFSIRTGEAYMESTTLINLLNYSQTLIQNGELRYLYYEQEFILPENVGEEHREIIEDLKRQLRENPSKSRDPEGLRKEILQELEGQKKYGALEDSSEWFSFAEVNLVYQPQPAAACRMEVISRFENFPSLGSLRFYGGDGHFFRFGNSTKLLRGNFAGHFEKDRVTGFIEEVELEDPEYPFYGLTFLIATNLPGPLWYPLPTDEDLYKVSHTKDSHGMPVYVITYVYMNEENEGRKHKIYVRFKNDLPEVFREETYYEYESQLSDEEGFRLCWIRLYNDFEYIGELGIAIPKVQEEQMFDLSDGFMERHIIVRIKDMNFNLDLPPNFFEWYKSDLAGDNDNHKKNRVGKKEESQENQK